MSARRRKSARRRGGASAVRVWGVRGAVGVGFVALVAGLMVYARSISPEARRIAAEERGQSTRSAWDSPTAAAEGSTSPYTPRRGAQAFEGGLERSDGSMIGQTHRSAPTESEHPAAAHAEAGERAIDVVRAQLVAYSGRSFPVALAQTHQWGQAYPGGIILLDSSVLTDDVPVMAFKYAHEWAHQVLGHVNPHHGSAGSAPTEDARTVPPAEVVGAEHVGTVPSTEGGIAAETQLEDEADAWAGAFLAEYGYDLEAVADYLREVPYNPTDTTHSSGADRADRVLAAAQQAEQ